MYRKFFKRFFDIIVSLLALILLSPVFLIVAILVKTKLGSPVLYITKRPGKDGKIFNLHKFRSMTNECDENGKLLPDAKRLTKLGRILRKTSIDELPELWDIFIGKMSLIGPRPLSPKYLPYYTEYENKRHDVRPGMTGLAQINGRSGLNWEERFYYDVQYVENISFFMDIKIFFKTIYKVLKRADTLEREDICLLNFYEHREIQWQNSKNYKEIGSEFWLADREIGDRYLDKFKNAKYVFSGRTAIDYIVKDIINKGIENIYLPSYLCQSIVDAVEKNNLNIIYYDVYAESGRFCADLPQEVVEKSAMFICDYFFFDKEHYSKLLDFAKVSGITVIHDITHSLLSDNLDIKDDEYYFASLRKWLPVPDGAILGGTYKNLKISKTLPLAHTEIKMQAMKKKRDYMLNNIGDKAAFIELYQQAEEIVENEYACKQISCKALDIISSINFNRVISARKNNAKTISQQLKDIGAFSVIYQEDCCPIFVPIMFSSKEQRDNFRNYMIEQNIYLPIHWNKPDQVIASQKTQQTYDNILSIVIDQRYAHDDMQKIVDSAKRFLEQE